MSLEPTPYVMMGLIFDSRTSTYMGDRITVSIGSQYINAPISQAMQELSEQAKEMGANALVELWCEHDYMPSSMGRGWHSWSVSALPVFVTPENSVSTEPVEATQDSADLGVPAG